MRIYTKTGDAGETGLLGGGRASKDNPRIAACGEVDELNAALGVVRSLLGGNEGHHEIDEILARIQGELFSLGADLAAGNCADTTGARITSQQIAAIERDIDRAEPHLAPLRQFILPGGGAAAAHLHLARATCRRAERTVVRLCRTERTLPSAVPYLNRLSDLLFILARWANSREGIADVVWESRSG